MLLDAGYAGLWFAFLGYIVYIRYERREIGWMATGLTGAVWVCFSLLLVQRGLASGHWPLTNRYEYALCFVWAVVGIYLLLEVSWREKRAGRGVLLVALFVATYVITRPATMRAITPLLPALRSPWLQIHVFTAVIAYAAFVIGAGLALERLLSPTSPVRGLPVSRAIEGQNRCLMMGFPWLTLSILSGAIWAHIAWGRYWGWDLKEVWALATWLWYLMILHLRSLRRWRDRRLAVLMLIGLGFVFFTFAGVPWLVRMVRLESLHAF